MCQAKRLRFCGLKWLKLEKLIVLREKFQEMVSGTDVKLGGGNSNIFLNFHPETLGGIGIQFPHPKKTLGKMESNLTCVCAYFSNGLGEKTHQLGSCFMGNFHC